MASNANRRRCKTCRDFKPGNAFAVCGGTVCRACARREAKARTQSEQDRFEQQQALADAYILQVREELGR